MIALLKEYCQESSLHGLLPIVLRENSRGERLFWGFLVIITAGTLVTNIYLAAQYVAHSQVEMIIENPFYDLKHVEFPAVTVCSNSKVIKSKLKRHVERLNLSHNDSVSYYNTILSMDLLRYPMYYLPNSYARDIVNYNVYPIPADDIADVMEKVRPSSGEIFHNCRWNGQPRNCRLLFRSQVTEEGFCHSFNSKSAERNRFDPPTLPPTALQDGSLECLRNNIAGRGAGLFFELRYLGSNLLTGHLLPTGYSVVIHNPNIYPDTAHKYSVFFKSYSYSRFSVSVSTVRVDESLHRISDASRGCELTRNVNQTSCHYNCRVREILKECGCLPYFMYTKNSQATICGIDHFSCLADINIRLRNPFAEEDIKEGIPVWSVPDVMNCSCTLSCYQTTYWADHVKVPREEEDGVLGTTEALASVEVTYETPFATSYIKRARFTLGRFIVGIGGIAGLLLSCSVFSLVELIILAYRLTKEAYFQLVIKKNIVFPFQE